jgi:hypothetical protein
MKLKIPWDLFENVKTEKSKNVQYKIIQFLRHIETFHIFRFQAKLSINSMNF